MVIELLTKEHDRDNFCSREPDMNEWLRKYALQNAKRDVCKTWVVVEARGEKRIIAYYSLSTGHVASRDLPGVVPETMAIPVMMLHRIAVDEAYQGREIGKRLITHIQVEVERIARQVGIHALVLEPLTPQLVPYYEKLHFKRMDPDANRMSITMKQVRAVLGLYSPPAAIETDFPN